MAEDVPVKAVRKQPAKKAPAKKVAKKTAGKANLSLVPSRPPAQIAPQDLPGADAVIDEAVLRAVELPRMDPAYEAYLLRQSGRSWAEVARRTGYDNVEHCSAAVLVFFQTQAVQEAAELRDKAFELEMERLDALQASAWDAAMEGNLDAANFVLKISVQRGKWHGWEREVSITDNRTIIISGGQSMAEEMRTAALRMHPHLVIDGGGVEG